MLQQFYISNFARTIAIIKQCHFPLNVLGYYFVELFFQSLRKIRKIKTIFANDKYVIIITYKTLHVIITL